MLSEHISEGRKRVFTGGSRCPKSYSMSERNVKRLALQLEPQKTFAVHPGWSISPELLIISHVQIFARRTPNGAGLDKTTPLALNLNNCIFHVT